MPTINVEGISINFPYEPYSIQIDYMSKIIEALRDGKNSLMESPTGTGKTLCLLCASLAWQEHMKSLLTDEEVIIHKKSKEKSTWNTTNASQKKSQNPNLVPKIIYSSRTHSQLSQCMSALKKTTYASCKVGMIASREQLCINPLVMKLESNSSKIYSCKSRIKVRSCHFYNKFETNRETLVKETKIVDIEELVTQGKAKTFCPFYMSRELVDSADILFMPYNYLLNSHIRRLYNIDLLNNVIIFDEAHNIESVCEENASVELTSKGLASCIEELRILGQYLYDSESSLSNDQDLLEMLGSGNDKENKFSLEDLLELKSNLLKLESQLNSIETSDGDKGGVVKSVDFLFDLLENCGFNHGNQPLVTGMIDQAMSTIIGSNDTRLTAAGVSGLERVVGFFNTVFQDELSVDMTHEDLRKHLSNYYRVHLRISDSDNTTKKHTRHCWDSEQSLTTGNRVLSYWCLSPGRTMRQLSKCCPRSIILTSGTLYTTNNTATDMDMAFEIEFRNKHIIGSDQMLVSVLTRGADGEALNSSYESRDKLTYTNSLGNVIVNLARVIPRGVLVVFPSYGMMRKCIERWETCDIYSNVQKYKQLIVEPQDKVKFTSAMEQFHTANSDPACPKGSILLAVARGKVSEGLDLSDHQGRAVIVVGLPYPAMMDHRVRLKMSFLDEKSQQMKMGIDGRSWYKQQAYRAVNQSVGRVIRHSRDFGAIYLCDERFASADSRSQLPLWMQSNISICDKFSDTIRNTVNFFRNVTMKFPPPSLGWHESTPSYTSDFVDESNVTPKSTRLMSKLKVNAPASSDTKDFSGDLSSVFKVYSEMSNEKSAESNNKNNSLMDFLNIAEKAPRAVESAALKRSFANISFNIDLSPEKPRKTKRYKLVDEKEVPMESAEYAATIKELFDSDKTGFRSYRTAIKLFKENNNIDVLFSSLNAVLSGKDRPGLVRDFHEFLTEEHKPRFEELCKSVLGLNCRPDTGNTENEPAVDGKLDCVYCRKSPANQPLGALCKHICCFSCWKIIIEGEKATKRCPKCKETVRRRNLIRINI